MTCSVVMAVYKNDKPEWFIQAIESILNQTVKSDDIIIVRDGPVDDKLENTLKEYENNKTIRVKRLSKNTGAGPARNIGVKLAKNELVAIMDADDISVPNRFELQLAEFDKRPDLSLVSGHVYEFEDDPSKPVSLHEMPIGDEAILKFMRRRCPMMNEVTMLKKADFLRVGGFPTLNRAEDYLMTAKLVTVGYQLSNIDEILGYSRISKDAIKRRQSLAHTKQFISVRRQIHKMGLTSILNVGVASIAQVCIMIMPSDLVDFIYRKALRR